MFSIKKENEFLFARLKNMIRNIPVYRNMSNWAYE